MAWCLCSTTWNSVKTLWAKGGIDLFSTNLWAIYRNTNECVQNSHSSERRHVFVLHKHHTRTVPSRMHITLMWLADNLKSECKMEWNMHFVKTLWANNSFVCFPRPFESSEVECWTSKNKHGIKSDILNLWCQCRFWALHLGKWIMFCHNRFWNLAQWPLDLYHCIVGSHGTVPVSTAFLENSKLLQRCFMPTCENVLKIINQYHITYWDTGWELCKTVSRANTCHS